MASVAEAAVAGAAVAPVLTHKDNKKWPKWRDMRHVLQHDDSGASIDSSVGILNSSREPARSCSHSQKFTVFDLVFGENRVDGGGLYPMRCDGEPKHMASTRIILINARIRGIHLSLL